MIRAPRSAAHEAVPNLDLSRSWTTKALFRLRGIRVPELGLPGLLAAGDFTIPEKDPPNAFVIGLVSHGLSVQKIENPSPFPEMLGRTACGLGGASGCAEATAPPR